ncbi:LysR family transcriptional regulator [Sphingomonas gei]|uniref:LysR family transcriptional regulator n=1 Tax=Sphingomonas gei TaxID=1395960 RepID=A0A4S1X104_9SPHN|nr:LysR family transcriptional regulator [Sphingomonas gei]TGX49594.1 LysR family transcriptional regulator [Sphingomonas gei]
MSDRWQEMAVFVRVAESGSLSRAAREMELSQPSISRIINSLETRLGITLLLRTTRSVSLTDAGTVYLDRARNLLAEMEEAEQAARGVDSLHGVIRLAMPVVYGTRAVIPALATFMGRNPDLRVEIIITDARQNLIVDGVDVAIRLGVGQLDDSTFGARKLAVVERMVVAAPEYLLKHGTPTTPGELASHDCIIQQGAFGRESWRFVRNKTVTSVRVSARLWTNSGAGVTAAALAGLGIALATPLMAEDELRSGRLVRLLEPYQLPPAEVWAVFPAGPKPSAKVRAIVDHLAMSLGEKT